MIEKIDSIDLVTLENGMKVAIEEMPWLPSVSFSLTLPLGTTGDPEGLEGSSIVLHDWLNRGAKGRSSQEVTDAINNLGIQQGGSTGKEFANFQGAMLVDVLPQALELYSDIIRYPNLSTEEFEPSRTVALQELASLDDEPVQRMFIALTRNYFTSTHGRSSYGTKEGLKALTYTNVNLDYQNRLSPNGTILSIAGGVKTAEVMPHIEKYFANWQGQENKAPKVVLAKSKTQHIKADSSQTQIGIVFKAVTPDSPDWSKNTLAIHVLSGGMSSRLFSEVREKRGLVYSVFASNHALKNFGYNLAYAGTTPERAEETLSVLLAELNRIYEGVTAEELKRAQTGILSNLVMQGESSSARASSLARDTFLRNRPRSLQAVKNDIENKTVQEINDFLHAQPKPNFTVLTLGPKEIRS